MDDLRPLLDYIDPAKLDYSQWLSVGMALKTEGYTASDWDSWSRRDASRYHAGECFKKWDSFQGVATPVKGGTLVQLAKEHGFMPKQGGYSLDWNDTIGTREARGAAIGCLNEHKNHIVVEKLWLEGQDVTQPTIWNPAQQIIRYLSTLFDKSEKVGYVTEAWEQDGKYLPTKGCSDRTQEQLIASFNKYGDDIGATLGDYNKAVGAWVRFNPLDGNGVKNENVTAFRYALVESDSMTIDKQNAMIRQLELPVACLVHSGGKSLHAIVRIDAPDYEEYRKRVDFLYNVCKKNGFAIDSQNRNPSRLSRLPGVSRGENKQFIVDTNFGKPSWQEWQTWIEAANDDLPEPESMASVWDCLPDLSPPLIDGILRQGHKMLLAGPSKAGKSYALIELCCAIAEGRKWLSWQCAQGRVLYVNLELDRASCLHRFKDVYTALGWQPKNIDCIDIWNLRGKSVPMDKLAPKLIRRAHRKNYTAIIIDPIYKVITGDENSADQMAHFCNQFDHVCNELGAAVIYCHHHSKGSQGAKRSMDRASGSGVFARDPDVLIDLIELELTEAILEQEENKRASTAWRIEGTLREFPKFAPVNLWFDYPVHRVDTVGVLADIDADGADAPWARATKKRKNKAISERKDKNRELENAINSCDFGSPPTKKQLAQYLGITERSVFDRVKAHGCYMFDKNNGGVIMKVEPR